MGLWLALSERHGISSSMPKGWGKAGQEEVLVAPGVRLGAFGEACGAGGPCFCLSTPWPLPQTCSSTSRTAGTWLSTTRAAFSRCGSTRAPACSSLGTWRCSSRGSWTTPPHPNPGRRGWQPSLQGEGIGAQVGAPRGDKFGPACHPGTRAEGLTGGGTWAQRPLC